MGKYLYLSFFTMAFAFCSVCQANEDKITLQKGIKSLTNIIVTYRSEFDRRVQFQELREAIDVIDELMRGYLGTARNKLDQVRNLNSEARNTYSNCVKPIFEWCISSNLTFNTLIPYIGSESLSKHDRDELWKMIVGQLDSGLNYTQRSLDLLNVVHNRTHELRNLFKSILHDLSYDFKGEGYYSKMKIELLKNIDTLQNIRRVTLISSIFLAIGALIFAPIGIGLGIAAAIGVAYGITDYALWTKTTSYEDQINKIEKFFDILQDKIRNASEIVEQINSALEEDQTNLHMLRGKISHAHIVSVKLN